VFLLHSVWTSWLEHSKRLIRILIVQTRWDLLNSRITCACTLWRYGPSRTLTFLNSRIIRNLFAFTVHYVRFLDYCSCSSFLTVTITNGGRWQPSGISPWWWRQYAPLKRLFKRDYTALYPIRLSASYLPPWEPEISHKWASLKRDIQYSATWICGWFGRCVIVIYVQGRTIMTTLWKSAWTQLIEMIHIAETVC
jgi:hypothetical protein